MLVQNCAYPHYVTHRGAFLIVYRSPSPCSATSEFPTGKEYSLPNDEEPRITPEQVFEVLQTCYDPCCKERAVSIVELGLIQGVQVAENGHDVRVELLLTSGWCPFSTHLLQMIDQNVRAIQGVGEVDTEIVWNTVWTPERMSQSARAKLSLPMAQLLPLRQRRLEREAREAQAKQTSIS